MQDWEKIEKDFYQKYDEKKKQFVSLNGFPEVDKKELEDLGSDYWTTYFTKVRSFLIKEVDKIAEKIEKIEKLPGDEKLGDNNSDDISVDDLPF
jgi:hypothetical protein